MPDTTYKIISEFEVKNDEAINKINQQNEAQRQLADAEKKTMLQNTLSQQQIDAREIKRRQGVLARQRVQERLNKIQERNNKLQEEAKNKAEQYAKANKGLTTLISGLIPRTSGLNKVLRTSVLRFGGLAAASTLLAIGFKVVIDGVQRSEVVMKAARRIVLNFKNSYSLLTEAIGELLDGNFQEFLYRLNNHNYLLQVANGLTRDLEAAQRLLAITTEEASGAQLKLNDELKRLREERQKLSNTDQTTETLRVENELINDQLLARIKVYEQQQKEFAIRKEIIKDQIVLNGVLGLNVNAQNAANDKIRLDQIKLQNDELKAQLDYESDIRKLQEEKIDVQKDLIILAKDLNEVQLQGRNDAIKFRQEQLSNLEGQTPGPGGTLDRQIELQDELIRNEKALVQIELNKIKAQREGLEIQNYEINSAKLSNKEREISIALENKLNILQERKNELIEEQRKAQVFATQGPTIPTLNFDNIFLSPEAIALQSKQFTDNLLRTLDLELNRINPELTKILLSTLAEGGNLEDALRQRDANILQASKALFEDAREEITTEIKRLQLVIGDGEKQLAGKLPEFFNEAEKRTFRTLELSKEQIQSLREALTQIDNELANINVSSFLTVRDINREALQNLQDSFNSLSGIFSTLSQSSQDAFDKQSSLVENQIDLINDLKDNTLEANSDIIQSEERKLARLIESRRGYANQIRDFARLEFVANTASAIASAAASGPLAVPQIFSIVAAVLSGLAKLRSASVFHAGTESVSDEKPTAIYRQLKPDEVPSILKKKERVLTVDQNAQLDGISNNSLVNMYKSFKAGQLFSNGFITVPQKESKYDVMNHAVLKEIKTELSDLSFNVSIDKRGFSAGLFQHMNSKKKINRLRK